MMRTLQKTTLCVLALLLGAACGPTNENTRETVVVVADSNSGDDVSITGARGLFDAVVNDNVSAVSGDNTDYKYVDVDSRGTLDIRIRFQQLTFGGLVSLHNDFGDILWEQSAPVGTEEVLIEGFETLPGRYYVRVFANEGAADYAIGQTFTPEVVEETWEPDDVPVEDVVEDTTEEDEARAERRRARRERRRAEREAREAAEAANGSSDGNSDSGDSGSDSGDSGSNSGDSGSNSGDSGSNSGDSGSNSGDSGSNSGDSGSNSGDSGSNSGDSGSNSGDSGSDSGDSGSSEPTSVRASIVNLRVSGSGTQLILRGCGSNSGLAEGASGRISNGSRATLSRITGSDSCEASSSASIGEMSGATHVTF